MSHPPVDPLLAALGSAAREEREEEAALDRFEPLAQADLPEDERARLEAEAAETPGGDDLLALLRPIDPAAHVRMAAAAAAALRGGQGNAASSRDRADAAAPVTTATTAPAAATTAPAGPSAITAATTAPAERAAAVATTATTAPSAAGGVVLPMRARWRGAAVLASALAIAAGVTLYVTTRGASPVLPAYEASIAGGVRSTRAPGDAPPTLVPGRSVRVRLRPEQAVTARVTALAALRQGERLTQLDGSTQTFEGGALALQVTVPADVPAGPAELIVVIAGEGDAPASVPAEPAADDARRSSAL